MQSHTRVYFREYNIQIYKMKYLSSSITEWAILQAAITFNRKINSGRKYQFVNIYPSNVYLKSVFMLSSYLNFAKF